MPKVLRWVKHVWGWLKALQDAVGVGALVTGVFAWLGGTAVLSTLAIAFVDALRTNLNWFGQMSFVIGVAFLLLAPITYTVPRFIKAPKRAIVRSQSYLEHPTRPAPEPPIKLRVLKHVVESGEQRNNKYGRWWLTVSYEVTTAKHTVINRIAVILGGQSESEYGGYSVRELLGTATWETVFKIPDWVQPGRHKVKLGAIVPIDRGYPETIFSSDEFEIMIPQ